MSIRVLAAIFLSGRETLLKGAWPRDGRQVCEDVQAAYRVVRSVGAQFAKEDIWPHVAPPGRDYARRQLDCGESALALRMFAPIFGSVTIYLLPQGAFNIDIQAYRLCDSRIARVGMLV